MYDRHSMAYDMKRLVKGRGAVRTNLYRDGVIEDNFGVG